MFHDKCKWGFTKVNFVDENNVFVGYELAPQCCEQAGWFVSDVIVKAIEDQNNQICEPEEMPDLEGWNFDHEFFQKEENCNNYEVGDIVIFRMVKGDEEKFLHLFNIQNGYYSHGFEFKVGNEIKEEGLI